MAKLVAIYQQTFRNNDPNANQQSFEFKYIPRAGPNQYFLLKCVYLSSLKSEDCDCDVFIKGIDALNGKCSYQRINPDGEMVTNEHWYLGSFSDNYAEHGHRQMRVADVPTSPFVIYTLGGECSRFVVSIQVQLMEEQSFSN